MLGRRLFTSLAFNLVVALWVWHDARRRGARKPAFVAVMALLFGPLGVAFYVADRPLADGETRRGGFGWQMALAFVLAWTALMPAMAVLVGRTGTVDLVEPGLGTLEVTAAWLPLLLGLWLAPAAIALGIGRWMRRPDEVHHGEQPKRRSGLPLVLALLVAGTAAVAVAWR